MEVFQFDGENIAYRYAVSKQEDEAEAGLVILVHPLGMNSDVWLDVLDQLLESYDVLMIDLPGHGNSANVTEYKHWSISQLAFMIQSLAENLGYEKARYVGTSIGGAIGQELLLSSPGFLSDLIVTNTSSKIGTYESWSNRALDVRMRGLAIMAEEIVPRWFSAKFIEDNPAVFAAWVNKLQMLDDNSYAILCEALGDWGVSEQLSTRKDSTRVFCVAGEFDSAMPLSEMKLFSERIQASEPLSVLPVGHVPSVENAAEFGMLIYKLLSK